MDPINYSIDVQSPIQAAAQGYQLGAGIRNDQFKSSSSKRRSPSSSSRPR
jgi:hypothetical protein